MGAVSPAGGAVGGCEAVHHILLMHFLWGPSDSREEMVLGSILLPSYEIRILPKEAKNRRFTFKVSLIGRGAGPVLSPSLSMPLGIPSFKRPGHLGSFPDLEGQWHLLG